MCRALGRILRPARMDRLGAMSDMTSPAVAAGAANESYSQTEIALANRNRGMPLEMLRHDITPVGMHYMLTHFDMPAVDIDGWRLELGGLVDAPGFMGLAEIQSGAVQTLAVTMECAGNGRSSLSPRPTNMPWGLEAIGTAEWTGVPLRDVMARAGVQPGAIELVFSAPDEGTQKGRPPLLPAQPHAGRGRTTGDPARLGHERPAAGTAAWRPPFGSSCRVGMAWPA